MAATTAPRRATIASLTRSWTDSASWARTCTITNHSYAWRRSTAKSFAIDIIYCVGDIHAARQETAAYSNIERYYAVTKWRDLNHG